MSRPFLIDRGDERLAEHLAHPRDVDRPDAGDLAPFTLERVAAHERGVVDHDVDVRDRRPSSPLRLPSRVHEHAAEASAA